MITLDQFKNRIKNELPIEVPLANPLRGYTWVVNYNGDRVCYQRGERKGSFYLKIEYMYDAYIKFNGQITDSNMLKQFNPKIYDEKHSGHVCHRSLLFLFLQKLKLDGDWISKRPLKIKIY